MEGTSIQRCRRRLAVTALLLLAVTNSAVTSAAPRQKGTNAETTCEVVSLGQWYCTIDGKGYYCDTNDKPDKNKNCRPARTAPSGPKGQTAPKVPVQPPVSR
jgi:hypothetical protein